MPSLEKLLSDIEQARNAESLPWIELKELEDLSDENLRFLILGRISFSEAREIQNSICEKRIAGDCVDTIIFCEHPPTLSLGQRIDLAQMQEALKIWKLAKVDIVKTDRGGELTFHGPGQLVVYPVISLKDRKIGVKDFVSLFFDSFVQALRNQDLAVEKSLRPAGVWVVKEGQKIDKICSAGLKITRGVSNHGFSLNISCCLKPYENFVVCGLNNATLTSLKQEVSWSETKNLSFFKNLCSIIRMKLTK
jgi:lipoyl(octanoyl) transferase